MGKYLEISISASCIPRSVVGWLTGEQRQNSSDKAASVLVDRTRGSIPSLLEF